VVINVLNKRVSFSCGFIVLEVEVADDA